MKKIFTIIFTLLLCFISFSLPVFAEGNGNTGETENKTTAVLAREARVTIKANIQELAQLRQQLREKITEQKEYLNQLREKTMLTTQDREQVKDCIDGIKEVKEKLTLALQNAIQVRNEYKNDKSEDRLTGLNKVIESQETRIQLLTDAIDTL